jgi:hypothetical protein
MLANYWLDRALEVIEDEKIFVKPGPNTETWFNRMPNMISAIAPEYALSVPEDFTPRVGFAHHFRNTRFGIEGVLKVPRKFHRFRCYVYYDKEIQPSEPFWVILRK